MDTFKLALFAGPIAAYWFIVTMKPGPFAQVAGISIAAVGCLCGIFLAWRIASESARSLAGSIFATVLLSVGIILTQVTFGTMAGCCIRR